MAWHARASEYCIIIKTDLSEADCQIQKEILAIARIIDIREPKCVSESLRTILQFSDSKYTFSSLMRTL